MPVLVQCQASDGPDNPLHVFIEEQLQGTCSDNIKATINKLCKMDQPYFVLLCSILLHLEE